MNRLAFGADDRLFVALAHLLRLDPFKQQLQARPVHFAACDIGPVADEPTLLKTFGPHAQAGSVEVPAARKETRVPGFQGRTSAPRDRQDNATAEIYPNLDSGSLHRPRYWCMRSGRDANCILDGAKVNECCGL